MIKLWLFLFLLHPMQVEYQGYAAHYNIGLMERVAHNRGLKTTDCMIASPFHRIGKWVYIQSQKNDKVRLCRVVDVPHPKDKASIIRRRIIAELDFNSAKELCEIAHVNQEPPKRCPITMYERLEQNGTSYYGVTSN
jgi:hypothetical protein